MWILRFSSDIQLRNVLVLFKFGYITSSLSVFEMNVQQKVCREGFYFNLTVGKFDYEKAGGIFGT
jgi:hypothetical protein